MKGIVIVEGSLIIEANVFLGISLGANAYTRNAFNSYLAWSKMNADSFACLIGDDIYALTHSVFNRCKLTKSMIIARAMGRDVARSIERLSLAAGRSTEIYHWRRLKHFGPYGVLKHAAWELYKSDSHFNQAVRNEVKSNITQRLKDHPIEESKENAHLWRRLDAYVIHEIAGLITMSEYCGYEMEIYPGHDVRIVEAIYRGEFPELKSLLPDLPKRRFQSVTFH